MPAGRAAYVQSSKPATSDAECTGFAMSSVGADLSAVSDYLVDATRGRLRHPLRVSQQRPPQRHDDGLTPLGLIAKQADPIDDCRRALVSSPADDARRADRNRPRPGQLLRPSGWLRFAARHGGHLFPYLPYPPSGVCACTCYSHCTGCRWVWP